MENAPTKTKVLGSLKSRNTTVKGKSSKCIVLETKSCLTDLEQCSLCGLWTRSENLRNDVQAFNVLLQHFWSERQERYQILQICQKCHSAMSRLRDLHDASVKISNDYATVLNTVLRLRKRNGSGLSNDKNGNIVY